MVDLQAKSDGFLDVMNNAYQDWENVEKPEPNEHGAISVVAKNEYDRKRKVKYDKYLIAKDKYDKSLEDLENAKSQVTKASN